MKLINDGFGWRETYDGEFKDSFVNAKVTKTDRVNSRKTKR